MQKHINIRQGLMSRPGYFSGNFPGYFQATAECRARYSSRGDMKDFLEDCYE